MKDVLRYESENESEKGFGGSTQVSRMYSVPFAYTNIISSNVWMHSTKQANQSASQSIGDEFFRLNIRLCSMLYLLPLEGLASHGNHCSSQMCVGSYQFGGCYPKEQIVLVGDLHTSFSSDIVRPIVVLAENHAARLSQHVDT